MTQTDLKQSVALKFSFTNNFYQLFDSKHKEISESRRVVLRSFEP